MSRKSTSMYLEETLGLLVQHFGATQVQSALAKVSNGTCEAVKSQVRARQSTPDQQANASISSELEQFRQKDREKYELLTDFYSRLKERSVLPESQDIRHFAQL